MTNEKDKNKNTMPTNNKTKKVSTYSKTTQNTKPTFDFAFEKKNYIWMLVGIVLLLIGYLLLAGGGSENPDVFNNDLFSARRLVVAPICMVAGIAVEIYAILVKPKGKTEDNTTEEK